ncbi:ankyrin repeat domain-containing protein [Sodalis sp. RH24]|uniref:ankyrin repeat domain-containing protein n=1 Tax=unclassified Sodalis (in: enterobacteria) TaxID=2636512 RepID=UPI0039B5838D
MPLDPDAMAEIVLARKDKIMYAGHYAARGRKQKRETELEAALALANNNPYGEVPLIYAASVGMGEVVKTFISQGVSVEIAAIRWPHKGMLPIHVATVNNQSAVVEILLDAGAQINACWVGMTALMLSEEFAESDISVTRLLLDRGIDYDARDFKGNTALMYAARLNLYDHFMAIFAAGADLWLLNNRGESVFLVASRACDMRIAAFLLAQGADVNETDNTGSTAMDSARAMHQLDMITLLTQAYQSNDAAPATAAVETTRRKPPTTSAPAPPQTILRPRGRSPGIVPQTGLPHTPARPGISDDIPDRPAEPLTPFMMAAKKDDLKLIDALLANRTDINEVNAIGRTALMQSAERGAKVTVNALLLRGANATLVDNNGRDALFYAARRGHTPVMALLQHHSAATSGAAGPSGINGIRFANLINKIKRLSQLFFQ